MMRPILILFISAALMACDIPPVGEGVWNIQVQTLHNVQSTVWAVTAEGNIAISGDITANITGAELAGSRISWSGKISNPNAPSEHLDVNFGGTVDGNKLQGTLYSTLGNWSVAGTRQR